MKCVEGVKIFSSGRTGAGRRGAARGMSCPPCSAGSPNTAACGCAESSRRCKTRKTPGADVFHRRRAFFTEGRNPRYAESAEWAGFPRSCFGRGVPAPVGVYWVLLQGRSRAPPIRGAFGTPPFLSEGERLAVQLGGGQLFAAVDELEREKRRVLREQVKKNSVARPELFCEQLVLADPGKLCPRRRGAARPSTRPR